MRTMHNNSFGFSLLEFNSMNHVCSEVDWYTLEWHKYAVLMLLLQSKLGIQRDFVIYEFDSVQFDFYLSDLYCYIDQFCEANQYIHTQTTTPSSPKICAQYFDLFIMISVMSESLCVKSVLFVFISCNYFIFSHTSSILLSLISKSVFFILRFPVKITV